MLKNISVSLGLLWYYYSGAETQEGGAADPEPGQQVEELAQMATTLPAGRTPGLDRVRDASDWKSGCSDSVLADTSPTGGPARMQPATAPIPTPEVGAAGLWQGPAPIPALRNKQSVLHRTSRRWGSRRHARGLTSRRRRSRSASHLDSQRWKTRRAKDLTCRRQRSRHAIGPAKPEGLVPRLASPPPEAVWSCACYATAACHAGVPPDPLHHWHHWIPSRPPELTPPCQFSLPGGVGVGLARWVPASVRRWGYVTGLVCGSTAGDADKPERQTQSCISGIKQRTGS
ncbi:uncharacterized protein LOC109202206 isoform X2 [Oreochromis niloticus]|uniref:uncharacterized protein LOC109202206 isoform X1 n=1 Tax=Oreochromis niloticus TaxID=8128 RepID=UPI000904857C|nr:uncharacterized protein LOC109202206 isoform X1 [Oreochromis niloticus]XP_019214417.1 uncharacterized protein LOC109202206 isoform X2 [Oreochromis niloticus]